MIAYAERPAVRVRQLAADLAVAVWSVGAILVGRWLYRLVMELRGPGARLEAGGDRFADGFDSVAERIGELPLLGEELRVPFTRVAEAGRQVEAAGAAQQEAVGTLALVLGIGIVVVLVGWVLSRYLPWRVSWMREAGAAARLRDEGADLAVFAHRAVAHRSLVELRRAVADPGIALREGRYRELAELELRALGLRTPSEDRPAPD